MLITKSERRKPKFITFVKSNLFTVGCLSIVLYYNEKEDMYLVSKNYSGIRKKESCNYLDSRPAINVKRMRVRRFY